MTQDIREYFDTTVIPLIARKHPDVVADMSIRLQGSVGLGLNDELSDMEAMVYLPENLWKARGGQLQLTLIHCLTPFSAQSHRYSECPGDPYSWIRGGHPEINVHPRSELLCGQAEKVFAEKTDVPWEKVSIEELHQLQSYPILRDSGGFLTRLRTRATAERYPAQLWTKRLILELVDLKGEPWDLEKAVRRGRPLEAEMILGTMLPALLRVAFLVNRRYYPWRKYLFPFFKDLPVGPAELLDEFEVLQSVGNWDRKLRTVSRIMGILTEKILGSRLVSSDMLEYLLEAKYGKAWENPNWEEKLELRREKAQEAGYDRMDGWIWGWWGWIAEDVNESMHDSWPENYGELFGSITDDTFQRPDQLRFEDDTPREAL